MGPQSYRDRRVRETAVTRTASQRQRRGRVSRNLCGTATIRPNQRRRPATPTTLLYLSCLQQIRPSLKILWKVHTYITVKAKYTLKVEQLESCEISRYNVKFNLFTVRMLTFCLLNFRKEEFWWKGVKDMLLDTKLPTIANRVDQLFCIIMSHSYNKLMNK